MMAAELQAWVGHLLIVGGRAVRMPPPGALAETAPRRAPHIRTGDTFFILVTPAGEPHAPAPFFQEMAALGTDTYFGSSGGITGGLREALTAIHQQAADQPVNALAVALRGEDVYAARGGRAFAALCQGGEVIAFPEERRDPLLASLSPLGDGSAPDIQLTHYAIAPGQMMLLGGPNLMDVDDTALQAALSGDGVQSALDALKALGRPEMSASVIRFAAPGVDDRSLGRSACRTSRNPCRSRSNPSWSRKNQPRRRSRSRRSSRTLCSICRRWTMRMRAKAGRGRWSGGYPA
jgi:hypothetical protein